MSEKTIKRVSKFVNILLNVGIIVLLFLAAYFIYLLITLQIQYLNGNDVKMNSYVIGLNVPLKTLDLGFQRSVTHFIFMLIFSLQLLIVLLYALILKRGRRIFKQVTSGGQLQLAAVSQLLKPQLVLIFVNIVYYFNDFLIGNLSLDPTKIFGEITVLTLTIICYRQLQQTQSLNVSQKQTNNEQ